MFYHHLYSRVYLGLLFLCGGNTVIYWCPTSHLFPTLGAVISHRQCEIGRGGSLYTTEIGKCHKLKPLFFCKPIVKYSPGHHWWFPLNNWMKKENVWKPSSHISSDLPGQKHVAGDTFPGPPGRASWKSPRADFPTFFVPGKALR